MKGLTANREKAEGWLSKNAIIVTALNPVIGYSQGAALVKEALAKNASIRELAIQKAKAGLLKHRDEDRAVTVEEINFGAVGSEEVDGGEELREEGEEDKSIF